MHRVHQGWRTIGQRRGRSRRGQVSAVATLFGLLLVVWFISGVLLQIPSQMAVIELQHELAVTNQVDGIQLNVLSAAANPNVPLPLVAGVRLGSDPLPPFQPPSGGALSAQILPFTGPHLGVGLLTPEPPNWHFGSPCVGNGNGTCSGTGSGPFVYYNQSGSHIVISPGVNGCGTNGCGVFYNISGNDDYIAFTTIGNNLGPVNFVINGNNDTMAVNYSGNCNYHRSVNSTFFGVYDTWTLNVIGCGSGGGGISANIKFIGISPSAIHCPYGDVTAHDKILPLSPGTARGVFVNTTWYNNVGTNTGPHTVPIDLSGTNFARFTNTSTGFYPCAFTVILNLPFAAFNGILVHLSNVFLQPTDIIYQAGAVIRGTSSGSAMVSPPQFTFTAFSNGQVSANMMLVQLVGGFPTTSGTGMETVVTQVLSEHSYTFQNNTNGVRLLTPFVLNVTTAYPQAWVSYFATANASVFPFGATCLGSVSQCVAPSRGTLVSLQVPLYAQQLVLTVLVVSVSL